MKHIYLHIICIILCFVTVKAQVPFTKEIWLNETNTPVKVNCIIQDKAGYLWLGTEKGLYRYNGKKFIRFKTIPNDNVSAIAVSNDKLWVGFEDGTIGYEYQNTFHQLNYTGSTISQAISAIHIVYGQTLIVATHGEGIFLLNNGYCVQYSNENGLSDNYVYNIVAPNTKNILAGTDRGINEIGFADSGFRIKKFTSSTGLPDNIVRVIKPMKKKCWSWIGTQQGGIALYCRKTNKIWTPQTKKPWKWGSINDILPLEDDFALICTDKGYLLDAQILDSDNLKVTVHHFSGGKLNKIYGDNTGNVWIATNNGLLLSSSNYMTQLPIQPPYSLQELTAIEADEKNIWLALGNKLYLKHFNSNQELQLIFTAKTSITNLHLDLNNTLWIGTFGDGLWYRETSNTVKKINHIAPLQNESVLGITHNENHLWVAGLNGIEELLITNSTKQLSLYKLHNKRSGVGSDYVYQIFTDSKNRVWMATDGAGVCMYHNNKYITWDSTSGMYSKVIYNITEDADSNIWVTTLNRGLFKYNGDNWEHFDKNDGIQDVNISSINANNTGQVFVTNAKGIDIWHPSKKQFRNLNKRSGLGLDSLSDVLELSARNKNGTVIIPFQKGLALFNDIKKSQDIMPKVNITGISIFFKEALLNKKEFSHSENHISFKFNGINLVSNEPIYYRYQLKGYNDMWIETGDEAVTFPQLPSGNYTFCVQASANSSFKTYSEALKKFYVAKPFWLQLWFIVLVIFFAGGVGYAYVKIRERNLRKVSSLQRERMLFEYEHLKSQVNPHFLFNSLNTLTSLIESDDEAALKYTNQLSDLYRNMLSYRNKDTISLEEEWEIMNNYLYIQKSRFGDALQFNSTVSKETRKTKRIVPMALQLLLENALKHNIVSMHKPLVISLDTNADSLIVRNTYQPKISKEKGAGLGLINIRKRYSLLTKKRVISGIEKDEFVVVIPLL